MIARNTLRAFLLAGTGFSPLAAYADEFDLQPAPAPTAAAQSAGFTGEIGVGLLGVAGKNANQAGRYTGLNTTGASVSIGEIFLAGRAPWDSGRTRYYEFTGSDLTFQTATSHGGGNNNWTSGAANRLANNGSLAFRLGEQGRWEAGATYEAITYTGNVIDSLYTVSGSQAALNNNLPPWGGATANAPGRSNPFTLPQLEATGAMQPVQVGTRRDIYGGTLKYMLGDWTFNGGWQHEHREGSMEESFAGTYAGSAFALPINYDTDRYDASAAYTTGPFQGLLQYTYSHFTDNNLFISLPYPIANIAFPFQQSAAYSTPPSTSAHYVTVMLASTPLPRTRINLNARAGLELQDNTLPPNTADPRPFPAGILNAGGQGTSANTLNATATIYQIKASVATRPASTIDTRAYYGVDGRKVSLNQYAVNTGILGGFMADGRQNPGSLQYVIPQDWLKQNAGVELGWRILPESDTKVTIGYRFDSVERSNAQAGHSTTSTATLALRTQFTSRLDGSLSFAYADRSAALNYLTPWQNLYGPVTANPVYSGAYYQAPMTSESVTARADYAPVENLSSGVSLEFRNQNYSYSAATPAGRATAANVPLTATGQGIKQDFILSAGPDINYRPATDVDLHAFYTYEMLFYNSSGNGACATPRAAATASCDGTAGYFRNEQTSTTQTIGFSAEWKINGKLKLEGSYTFSYGSVMFSQFNGVFAKNSVQSYQNVANYPDINSTMNNLRITATYQMAPGIELVFLGAYTTYRSNDWNDTANAIQGGGTSAIATLTPGYAAPNYSVAALLTGAKIRF